MARRGRCRHYNNASALTTARAAAFGGLVLATVGAGHVAFVTSPLPAAADAGAGVIIHLRSSHDTGPDGRSLLRDHPAAAASLRRVQSASSPVSTLAAAAGVVAALAGAVAEARRKGLCRRFVPATVAMSAFSRPRFTAVAPSVRIMTTETKLPSDGALLSASDGGVQWIAEDDKEWMSQPSDKVSRSQAWPQIPMAQPYVLQVPLPSVKEISSVVILKATSQSMVQAFHAADSVNFVGGVPHLSRRARRIGRARCRGSRHHRTGMAASAAAAAARAARRQVGSRLARLCEPLSAPCGIASLSYDPSRLDSRMQSGLKITATSRSGKSGGEAAREPSDGPEARIKIVLMSNIYGLFSMTPIRDKSYRETFGFH